MEKMLDKKQIWAIFLFKFKWVVKQGRQLSTSKTHLAWGPANEHTVHWWFKKFCKGDESLEDEEHGGQPSEVDSNQLKAIIKADPLTTTQEVAEDFNVQLSPVIQRVMQLERWKSSVKWVMSWPKIRKKKKSLFWSVIFSYSTQQWTISQSDCNMQRNVDFIQLATVVEPKSSKASPKAKLGGLLPVWSTTAFWIRAKPLPLRSMFNKSMRCTKNCKACSQNWSTERAQFSMTRPDCISHSQCFKSWRINWATKACLICHTHLSS